MIRIYTISSGSKDAGEIYVEKVEVDGEVKCTFDHEQSKIDFTPLEDAALIGQPVEMYKNGEFKSFKVFKGVSNTEHGKELVLDPVQK